MSKSINFTKMQGLGNDFILVDYDEFKNNGLDYAELAIKMCDRNFGIGADGLIIVNPENMKADTDTSWRIFNSDGTEPQMCGNGIRCFAKYVYNKKLVNSNKFTINTLAGIIAPEILDTGDVKVDMGEPILEASKIPTNIKADKVIDFSINVDDKTFNINAISMGNPHCIVFTDDDAEKLALKYGAKIENHETFPEKTNVEFVKVIDRNNLKVNVWERGCGITLACGTGACATVVASTLNNLTENIVKVSLPGGVLHIEWQKDTTNKIFMTGESKFVFDGKYFI